MILTGLARLGRDIECRYLPDGTAVGNIALAWNYGKKGQDGKRPTQWVQASIWGERVEKLAPYLLKGAAVSVVLDDVHVEHYDKSDGTQGTTLKGRVSQLEFAGGGKREGDQTPAQPAARPASAPAKPAPTSDAGGFDTMMEDIPFNFIGRGISGHAI